VSVAVQLTVTCPVRPKVANACTEVTGGVVSTGWGRGEDSRLDRGVERPVVVVADPDHQSVPVPVELGRDAEDRPRTGFPDRAVIDHRRRGRGRLNQTADADQDCRAKRIGRAPKPSEWLSEESHAFLSMTAHPTS
jgi:hypothetical protein